MYARGVDDIQREADACGQLGIDASLARATPLPFPVAASLCFRDQAQLHPRAYILALAAAVSGDGCTIFEDSHVTDVDDGDPCRVSTIDGEVVCDDVIVATNVPVTHRLFFPTKIPAYRTYAIAARTDRLLDALCWDTDNPYHYIRTHTAADGAHFLIVGGEDHKTGQQDDTHTPFRRLEAYVRQRFGEREFVNHWSGQIVTPLDGLPYIGRTTLGNRVFIATGFAGQGLTMGTLAATLLSDLLLGVKNPYADLYRPSRIKPWSSARSFLRENLDFPTHVIADRLRRRGENGEMGVERLPPGEGAVLNLEGKRLAVYRDHAGHLSAVSAVCTHLGCVVQWNSTEKSWDCPCHGSRFEPTGRVLNGPAIAALPTRELPTHFEAPGPEDILGVDEEHTPRRR
jgi:nitrite reductase/ring-hydroxylating ferredoxin subunit